jgi:hypothetical protein
VSLKAYSAQSVGDGAEWPRACDLITRDDVQAVLPQATQLELKGDTGGFDYKVVGLGTYETPQAGSRYGRSRHIDIPEQKCEAQLKLPSDAAEDDIGVHVSIQVTVEMVGSKDTVDYFWSPGRQPLPDSFGADECTTIRIVDGAEGVSTVDCRKGEMSVEVVGILTGTTDERHPEDVAHLRLAGQPANTPPDQVDEWFRTRVVPQLVGVVARRMP